MVYIFLEEKSDIFLQRKMSDFYGIFSLQIITIFSKRNVKYNGNETYSNSIYTENVLVKF